ncbi:MAG: AAA family ATPase [Armatimonadota bacterium]
MPTATPPITEEPPVDDIGIVDAVMHTPPPAKKPPFPPVLNLRELFMVNAVMEWLLTNILCRGDLFILYGDSASGKSYIAICMAMALACGVAWCNGRFEVPAPRLVVYIAGEGWRGLKNRFFALASEYGRFDINIPEDNLRFLPVSVQLFDPASPQTPQALVEHLTQQGCPHPDLLIIDTMSRASVGADENGTPDMNVIVGNCDYLQRATGAAIMLVHHANKLGSMRGSTLLRASADVVLFAQKLSENNHVLKCDKMKDGEFFDPIPFSFYPVEQSSVIDWSHEGKPANEGSAAERVLEFLANHPGTLFEAKDIAYAVNIQPTHVSRAVKVLGKQVSTMKNNPHLPASKANPTLYQYAGETAEAQPEASL